jgi:hypothetical protein
MAFRSSRSVFQPFRGLPFNAMSFICFPPDFNNTKFYCAYHTPQFGKKKESYFAVSGRKNFAAWGFLMIL